MNIRDCQTADLPALVDLTIETFRPLVGDADHERLLASVRRLRDARRVRRTRRKERLKLP